MSAADLAERVRAYRRVGVTYREIAELLECPLVRVHRLAFGPIPTTVRPVQTSATTMDAICAAVCAAYEIPLKELMGLGLARRVSLPRQHAMSLIYATGLYSLPSIGAYFERDHTTILSGVRSHNERANFVHRKVAESKMSPPGQPCIGVN